MQIMRALQCMLKRDHLKKIEVQLGITSGHCIIVFCLYLASTITFIFILGDCASTCLLTDRLSKYEFLMD